MKMRRVVAGLLASVWAFAFVACESEKTGATSQSKTIVDLYSYLAQYEDEFVTIEDLQQAVAEGYVDSAVLTQNGCAIYGDVEDGVMTFGETSTCTHKFTVPTTRANANCTEFGYATAVCSACRATQFTFTGALGHDWKVDEHYISDVPHYICDDCGATHAGSRDGSNSGGVSSDDSTKDVLRVYNQQNAVGDTWLENAAKRFEEKYADTAFSDGKKGVQVTVLGTTNDQNITNSMQTSGYQMYFARPSESIIELAQMGLLKDITDVVCEPLDGEDKSIQDKIYDETRSSYLIDGKYYALPHYEAYAGLTYDLDLFTKNNLFFADGENGDYYASQFGGAYFVQSEDDTRSCGPDGMYGTQDDGLPSSLEEFLILCDYMDNMYDIAPLSFAGAHPNYANLMVSALWASLAGQEKMNTVYTHQGQIEVVVGFANEPLFDGIEYIQTPITEMVNITEDNAHLAYDMVERYYATAIMEIAETEGWFTQDSYKGTTRYIDAQNDFVLGGVGYYEKIGMLIEGSWWHNEATENDVFDDYAAFTDSDEPRNLAWMSLPAQLYGSVTEGNGYEQTLTVAESAYAFINANVDATTENICKEFLRFLYSDEELQCFTQETGMLKAVEYQMTDNQLSEMDTFQRSVYTAKISGNTVRESMDNQVYLTNRATLSIHWTAALYRPTVGGRAYGSYIQAILQGHTAAEIFNATRISQNAWVEMINY